jgi:hypothetical protein
MYEESRAAGPLRVVQDRPLSARIGRGATPEEALAEEATMRKTLTTVRCVPRCGFDFTEVRTVDLELRDLDEETLLDALRLWFAERGIADAVYAIEVDDNGPLAIVNDEAFCQGWGEPLL